MIVTIDERVFKKMKRLMGEDTATCIALDAKMGKADLFVNGSYAAAFYRGNSLWFGKKPKNKNVLDKIRSSFRS